MKVFISWSGERSKQVAVAIREWLPMILQYVEPWMSEADISAGDRWSVELSKQLEESGFGIICLTSIRFVRERFNRIIENSPVFVAALC